MSDFLRTVPNPVSRPAGRFFRCRPGRDRGLSLYKMEPPLSSEEELRAFQRACVLPSGDLPAVWCVSKEALDECELNPEHKPHDRHRFGQLHYETRCPDEAQSERLALKSLPTNCSRRRARHWRPLSMSAKLAVAPLWRRFADYKIGSPAPNSARSAICRKALKVVADSQGPLLRFVDSRAHLELTP